MDSIKNNKIQFNLVQFNFKTFFENIVSNLKISAKLRKTEISLSSNSDEEIYAVYDIYRIIFFNLLQFLILTYGDKYTSGLQHYKDNKTFLINVQFKKKKFFNQHANFFKTNVSFTNKGDDFTAIDDVLKNIDFNKEFSKSQFYDLVKVFDIGILTVYYLIKVVYNGEISVERMAGSTLISFTIGGISPLLNEKCLSAKEKLELTKLSEINIETERIIYDEILKKFYGLSNNDLINKSNLKK